MSQPLPEDQKLLARMNALELTDCDPDTFRILFVVMKAGPECWYSPTVVWQRSRLPRRTFYRRWGELLTAGVLTRHKRKEARGYAIVAHPELLGAFEVQGHKKLGRPRKPLPFPVEKVGATVAPENKSECHPGTSTEKVGATLALVECHPGTDFRSETPPSAQADSGPVALAAEAEQDMNGNTIEREGIEQDSPARSFELPTVRTIRPGIATWLALPDVQECFREAGIDPRTLRTGDLCRLRDVWWQDYRERRADAAHAPRVCKQ